MRIPFVLLLLMGLLACKQETKEVTKTYQTKFESSRGDSTATYQEVIDFYFKLARNHPSLHIQTMGLTDSGQPLHLVSFNPDAEFNFQKIAKDKVILLINNGIHPGEPDGIDATMMLFRDYATGKIEAPANAVLVTIPLYNIGGAMNRNSFTRANQQGPSEYGFRGNAKNLDLNRDFIKNDSENAKSFAAIFHQVKPDLFIDNHVSNGADYQYTISHLFTQHNKLGGALGTFQQEELIQPLEQRLAAAGWTITPYVNVHGVPPDQGFSQFMDYPRYSTGYTALWNVPGLMVETHMLKPYTRRVEGTYLLLATLAELASAKAGPIKATREEAFDRYTPGNYYPISWAVDSTRTTTLNFMGYEADTLLSEVTGQPRLRYNRERPFTRPITYYNHYRVVDSVQIPEAYLLPPAYRDLRSHLDRNQIRYRQIDRDTTLVVERYEIAGYKTYSSPYEGHYPHYDSQVHAHRDTLTIPAGYLYIPLEQAGSRYLLEVFEPQATDSFFNWNFFDPILGRKEGYSEYVFEETAKEMLLKDSLLRLEFQKKKDRDVNFRESGKAQLDWLYARSAHAEEAYLAYPVLRVPAIAQ